MADQNSSGVESAAPPAATQQPTATAPGAGTQAPSSQQTASTAGVANQQTTAPAGQQAGAGASPGVEGGTAGQQQAAAQEALGDIDTEIEQAISQGKSIPPERLKQLITQRNELRTQLEAAQPLAEQMKKFGPAIQLFEQAGYPDADAYFAELSRLQQQEQQQQDQFALNQYAQQLDQQIRNGEINAAAKKELLEARTLQIQNARHQEYINQTLTDGAITQAKQTLPDLSMGLESFLRVFTPQGIARATQDLQAYITQREEKAVANYVAKLGDKQNLAPPLGGQGQAHVTANPVNPAKISLAGIIKDRIARAGFG